MPLEEALILAQHYELDEQLVIALGGKATLLATEGRPTEAQALYEMQASVARRLGRAQAEALANGNLSDLCMTLDIAGADEHCQAALAAARRVGARRMEETAAGNLMYVLIMAGRLDEAYRIGTEVHRGGAQSPGWNQVALRLAWIEAIRGNSVAAREHLEPSSASADSDDVSDARHVSGGRGLRRPRRGRHRGARSRLRTGRLTRIWPAGRSSRTKRSESPIPRRSRPQ